ncbi:MAG: iron-containing alcohol dehydrogenase [Deltaproteobacteria bacterium]|jgi:1,3-propanediol dehydrogenase/alcohol dehydrogenase|nr:iron-containing alcohol dehydrogenase [Deltaproteobacteria bacterium]
MSAVFQSPPRMLWGAGCLAQAGAECANLGKTALVVAGKASARASGVLDQLEAHLRASGVACAVHAQIGSDPDFAAAAAGADLARELGAEVILALGGGSALDAGKAIAALAPAGPGAGLESISGCPRGAALPLLASPSTAGSGSEVSRVAVLVIAEKNLKLALSGDGLIPAVAILDPDLTLTLPPRLTAITGLDALTHAMEAYLSPLASPQTDLLALSAIRRMGSAFLPAVFNGKDQEARAGMLLGQAEAGLACSNAGAGLIHAMGRPLGLRCALAHGLACALLLPAVMEFNRPACEERMAEMALALGVSGKSSSRRELAGACIAVLRALLKDSGLPETLGDCGVRQDDLLPMAEIAAENQSALLNVRRAGVAQILELYQSCL